MSIVEQIQRIKHNLARAYSALLEKGAKIPSQQNSENLFNAIESISSSVKYGITVDNFLGDIDSNGQLHVPISGTLNAKGIVTVDNYTLACKFGGNAWGTSRPQGLKSIIFPNLQTIGNAGLAYFYTYSTDLETIEFPELLHIGQCGMERGFECNSALKSVSFPKLKTLFGMYSSLEYAFYNCNNLEYVNLDSLEQMTSKALAYAFANCTKLKELSFPSLTSDSFGCFSDQFDSMLANVQNCTVHFPYRIKDIISEWNSVNSGFGGKNTVILFDLHIVNLNFISNNESLNYKINEKPIIGSSGYAEARDILYSCYDNTDRLLFRGIISNTEEYETIDINIEEKLKETPKKIMLSTEISGLDVYFRVCGNLIKAQEESLGNYSISLIGDDVEIEYYICGGDNYSDLSGTVTTSTDKVILITMKIASWVNFERPNLLSNGKLGGNSFAVISTGQSSVSYPPYNAVNGRDSSYWEAGNDNITYTFYNPVPLKVSQIEITYYSNSTFYVAKNIIVMGSHDNSNWEKLAEFDYIAGEKRVLAINSCKTYKYHKLLFTKYSYRVSIVDLNITATYKEEN